MARIKGVLNILARVALGLIFIVLLLLFLVHSPPAQQWITVKVSDYITNKTGAKVNIEAIDFSLLGEIAIKGLEVKDPTGNPLFSSEELAANPDLMRLLTGDLSIQSVELKGVWFHLVNTADGLNIRFILDAFKKPESAGAADPKPFAMQVGVVDLSDISFEFTSIVDSSNITSKLGSFSAIDFNLSTQPNVISLEKLFLEQTSVEVITSGQPQPDQAFKLPPLDFGSGFKFEVGIVEFKQNRLALHQGTFAESQQFDPEHLIMDSLNLFVRDVLVSTDSLSLNLEQLSVTLPGIPISHLSGDLGINQHQFALSELNLSTSETMLDLNISSTFENWSGLINDLDHTFIDLTIDGSIDPFHFELLLQDAGQLNFERLPVIEISFDGALSGGDAKINTASIIAGDSRLLVNGSLNQLLVADSLSWKDLMINTAVGKTFANIAAPYTGDLNLPEEVLLEALSSGEPDAFDIYTEVKSSQGAFEVSGQAGLLGKSINMDVTLDGKNADLGKLIDIDWLGLADFSMAVSGSVGEKNDLMVDGHIEIISISGNPIENIDLSSQILEDKVLAGVVIRDTNYGATIDSELLFSDDFNINSELQFDSFNLSKLLQMDTSFFVSGDFHSMLTIQKQSMDGYLDGHDILIATQRPDYLVDSLSLKVQLGPDQSNIDLYSDDISGQLDANFDMSYAPDLIQNVIRNYQDLSTGKGLSNGERKFVFNLNVEEVSPLELLSDQVDDFTGLYVKGEFDEMKQILKIDAEAANFSGFGVTLDKFQANFEADKSDINTGILVDNLLYDSIRLGNLNFQIIDKGDSAISNLSLRLDTISILDVTSNIRPTNQGVFIYLDSLVSFNRNFEISGNNRVLLRENNVLFENLTLTNSDLELLVDGDLDNFKFKIENGVLRTLNYLIPSDSAKIQSGNLNAFLSYKKKENNLNVEAEIDSLTFMDSPPIDILIKAISEEKRIPIEFALSSASNNINLNGNYYSGNSEIDALLDLDVNDLEMFQFLFRDKLEKIQGKVHGQTKITGTLSEPKYQGSIRFVGVDFTTRKPRSTFQLEDETLTLDNSGFILENFMVRDQWQNPLVLNGRLIAKDFGSFEYDLSLKTDNYLLLNNPATKEFQVQGILVVGSNLQISGNAIDTNVEAEIVIKDTTNFTYVVPQTNLELVTNEGIVEFIDPEQATDSLTISESGNFYDSLVAVIPNFNLKSEVVLEDQALFRVLIDANSGDFIEVAGAAKLQLEIDRTGNVQLNGTYAVTKGFYQLYFYDLVKKRFDITPGSSINWSGNPNNGTLDFKAVHYIKTSSIGLLGNEIGENEKSVYRRPLQYEVGIIIQGTIDSPEISFTLDLPEDEKVNYPALQSKLSRLKQPEFESELNKQVFGLLVLGGFLPEASGSEFDQSLVATTALSNSVNSLLASQLNRFASQFIKGVDINLGLQSYSDYSTGGGQTRTAMDFRVTKRLMNDRLSVEVGGDVDINSDQSGARTGSNNFRGDITVIYDLTESGSKKLKAFNNETYDIIYHEIRNTGISLIFIREFDKGEKRSKR